MSTTEQIGKRLRNYREKLKFSLEDLARNTGISEERLAEYEAGTASASIGVMIKLSRALGQRVGTFMDDHNVSGPSITRVAEREEVINTYKESEDVHYRYHGLSSGKADRHMEPFYVKISPSEEISVSSHEGEEFIMVMKGQLKLVYGNETHVLNTGDTMYYNSIVPHSLSAVGGDAEICAVVYSS